MTKFKLKSDFKPAGDQPTAITQLTNGLNEGLHNQTLMGVTGSGKTFSMASVIQNVQRPTLVLSHNKTLAAQLYSEFRHFFPENAVHYFVSYFDYYQPEAYIPRSDTYIEKDSQINEEIDRLRHAATDALLSRKDVIIVASVSCIYGIGSVEDYNGLSIEVKVGERKVRDKFLRQLTDIQYQRNDIDFHRSTFRVRGDVVDVFPASEELAYRIEFFGDEVERVTKLDPLTGEILANLNDYKIFPGSHYVTPQAKLKKALGNIEQELAERLALFKKQAKLLEAQRLEQRTRFDIEMLDEDQTAYNLLLCRAENYRTKTWVVKDTAWTTQPEGLNTDVARKLMGLGFNVLIKGPEIGSSLAQSESAYNTHVILDHLTSAGNIEQSETIAVEGYSRGSMIGFGTNAYASLFDREVIYSNLTDPCVAIPIGLNEATLKKAVHLPFDLALFGFDVAQILKRPNRALHLVDTVDISLAGLAQFVRTGRPLMNGEAGALAASTPQEMKATIAFFRSCGVNDFKIFRQILAGREGVEFKRPPGGHGRGVDTRIIGNIGLRFGRLGDQLEEGRTPSELDYQRIHLTHHAIAA